MSLFARATSVSPFGPIFAKELRVTSRRKRTYLLRVGYLVLLLLALLLAYASAGRSYGGLAAQMQRQAALGTAFFAAFTLFSVGSMGLIGPVLTANAIGGEKLAKTLPVLLMTPITAWQVVGGKLLSRVLIALMLMGLSLPVLALCRLLGGVELTQMLSVLALATSVVISCAAIGLFLSLFMNRAAVVILLSYAILGLLYILLPVVLIEIFDIGDGGPRSGAAGISFLCAINPFMCAGITIEPRARAWIGDIWIASVLVQLGLAAGLVAATASLLRRQFRNAGEKPIATPLPAAPLYAVPMAQPMQPADLQAGVAAPPDVIAAGPPPMVAAPPLPDALRSAPRPARPARDVSDNPVLWRELRRSLLPKYWQRVVGVIAVLIIMLLIYGVLAADNDLDDAESQIGFACVFFGVWWLLSAVLSATAISQEKETDTWTLLLATPMSGRQIVWGKVIGLARRLLWPTVLIAVHFLLFVIGGVIPLWTLLLVLLMTVACNSVWIATGVWISLKIKKVTFAVVANLLLAVAAYGLIPLMIMIPAELLTRDGEDVGEQTGWYIPYMYLAQGFEGVQRSEYVSPYGSGYYDGYGNYGYGRYDRYWLPGNERVGAATFFAVAMLCAGAHLLLAYIILQRTGANFDEIVGRAGRRRFVGINDSDDAVLPVGAAGGTSGRPSPEGALAIASSLAFGGNAAAPLSDASPDLYASLPRRIMAGGIDLLIVQFASGIVGLIWGVIHVLNNELIEYDEQMANSVMLNHLGVAMLVGLAAGLIYAAYFESSRRRATPGKMLMGVFVTDIQGRRVGFGRAALRHLGKILSIVPLGIGYLEVLVNRRRQAMHDRIADTVVLRK